MNDSLKIILYSDGASLGNPGKAGIGFLLYSSDRRLINKDAKPIGVATNNVAEYLALIYGMQAALSKGARELICYSDSELLVNQVTGKYKVRNTNLLLLYNQVKHLIGLFEIVRFNHISRDNNSEADKLAKKAAKGTREWMTTGKNIP